MACLIGVQCAEGQPQVVITLEPLIRHRLESSVKTGHRTQPMSQILVSSQMTIFLMTVWRQRKTTVEIQIQITWKASGATRWILV